MDTKKIYSIVTLCMLVAVSAVMRPPLQGQSKVGTTAAQFLGISVGARAIAMGSAYVSSSTDVSSLYWNPGAIVQADRSEFNFTNTQWLVGTKFRWFGLMLNLDGENALGLSVTQLNYGEEEVTTVTSPEGTGENWSAQDLAVALSYSRRLTDRFSIGGSAKYINQSIYNEAASNLTFDLGLLYVTEFNGLRIGMSMSNFGGDLQLSGRDLLNQVNIDPGNAGGNKTLVADLKTDSWSMPLLFRVGVGMNVYKNDMFRATVALDALRPSDNHLSTNVGGEIGYQEMVFLRGGYKSFYNDQDAFSRGNQQEGLSLGAGVRYAIQGATAIQVDYAFSKFGLFGNLNTIALSIGF
jgi:opacity protein-like surface antigen